MASSKEVALGIASALGSEHCRDPFPMSFRGQTLSDAAQIIIWILEECRDADIPLARVALDPALRREIDDRALGLDVQLLSDAKLNGEVRFYREPGGPAR